MLALGFPLLNELLGKAAITLFVSLLGYLLLFGLIVLAVSVATVVFLTRSRELNDSSPQVTERRAEKIDRILKRTVPAGNASAFSDGFTAPLDGLRFMNAFPWHQCWRHAIAPAICNLVISALVVASVVAMVAAFAMPVHNWFEPTTLSRILEFVTFALLIAVTVGTGFGVWLFLQNVVCGYFFSNLAVKTEVLLGTEAAEIQEQSLAADINDAARDTAAFLATQTGFLLTNLVPGVGSLVSAIGGAYFGAMFAGTEFQSYPLCARGSRGRIGSDSRSNIAGMYSVWGQRRWGWL